jgi:hypothetical protein
MMRSSSRLACVTLLALGTCAAAAAQLKREMLAYPVSAKPVISIRNQFGRITVSPTSASRVVATVVHSAAVEIRGQQTENRIELTTGLDSNSAAKADNVDYQVLVPPDACVILSTAAGSLVAENLEGDLIFEGTTASVDAHSIRNAHVHVKTLSGPVTLRQVSNGVIDVTTASGDVSLQDVTGPMVEVHSGTGRILYSGDPGDGAYKLVTGTGNIDVFVPFAGQARFKARSVKGKVANAFIASSATIGLGFASTQASALRRAPPAAFDLHSFRGNISVRESSK